MFIRSTDLRFQTCIVQASRSMRVLGYVSRASVTVLALKRGGSAAAASGTNAFCTRRCLSWWEHVALALFGSQREANARGAYVREMARRSSPPRT